MSVVEFSADSWQAVSPGLSKGLAKRMEALSDLVQGLESLAASGNISGQGADGMRAYIREVHVPLVQSLLVGLSTFQTAIGVYWNGYAQVDSGGNFRLVNDEFDAHLTQLDTGMGELRGFADDLRAIAASASHLVSLGGAGANAADRAVEGFEGLRLIVKTQKETWEAYEATDPGFNQVKALLAELNSTVKNIGTLTVGQGRAYTPGSFDLTRVRLGGLLGGMLEYCESNQQVAADGWEALINGYVDDVEAEEERKRKEEALWGVLWDGLQIVGGAVIAAIGVGLTPFSAGFSLGLTVLGGSMVVGGVNSMVNHVSIATTGQGLNLIGMASDGIGQWYDANIAQPAAASGNASLQFLAGVGAGVGDTVSGALQLNVVEVGTGIVTLATSQDARDQLWGQVTTMAEKVASGDTFAMGQITGNLIPLGPASKFGAASKLGTGARIASVTDKVTSALGSAKVVIGNTADTVKHALAGARDDFLTQLGNAERKLAELGQNMVPAHAFAGIGSGLPSTPITDKLTQLLNKADTPTTPRPGTGGGGNGPTVSTQFAPATRVPDEVPHPRGKMEVEDPFDPNRKGALLPNVTYRTSAPGTNHNYIYETNSRGLIDRVLVDVLHLKPKRPRLTNDRNTPGKRPGDEAGHLVADLFDGDPTLRNLVSQAWKLNRGAGSEWAAMERVWRDALTDTPPKKVTDVVIEVIYDSNQRPIGFDVSYKVGGIPDGDYFPNPVTVID